MPSTSQTPRAARPQQTKPHGWRRWTSLLSSFVLGSFAGGGASALFDGGWAALVVPVLAFVIVFASCSLALDLLLAPRRSG